MTDQNSIVLIIFLFFHSGLAGKSSFIMSFQTSTKFGKISTEEWAEFTGNIPDIEEFSVCQWEMMKYFNERSYCTEVVKDNMQCIQFYHEGLGSSLNRHLRTTIWMKNIGYSHAETKPFRHRAWNLFCITYSSNIGVGLKTYYNGKMIKND